MVREYLQFGEQEQFEALSRATLFRVLEVREASQQKSLSDLDNKPTAGFERLDRIVEELNQIGLEKSTADEWRRALRDGKRYFKAENT